MLSPSLLRPSLKIALLTAAFSVVFLADCAMQQTASEGNALVSNASISGMIHGGQAPIAGATVNLYAAGTMDYGKGATLLATTTSAAGTGAFNFSQVTTQTGASSPASATYGCPTSSSLLYLTATGGDPTGAGTAGNVNGNIQLMSAIGACSTVGTGFYVVNEVSTAVSVAALQQYISPLSEQIGAPSVTGSGANASAAQTGMTNAFALVGQLMSLPTGTANTTYTPASMVGTITATFESAKINTIADIIAACINVTGSQSAQCTSLFNAATQPTVPSATNYATSYSPAVTPADTLQVVLFMLQNPTDAGTQVTSCAFTAGAPTSNLNCLYSAQTASAPFVGLTTQPTDWTVGVTYASNSLSTTSSSATAGVLAYPEYVAIDKLGNVWIANGVTTASTTTPLNASLTELSPQGGTVKQVLTNGQLFGPQVLAIDPTGNVWVPNLGSSTASNAIGYGTTVVEYPASGSPAAGNSFTVGGCPYGVSSDGAGNIYVGECSTTVSMPTGNGTPGNDVREIAAGAVAGSTASVISGAGYQATKYSAIAVDSNFDVWTTGDSAYVQTLLPTAVAGTYTQISNTTAVTDAASISIDNSNDAWVGNYATTGGAGLSEVSVVSGAIAPATGSPFSTVLGKTSYSAMDGAQNTWITTQTASTGPVFEFAHTGALLTPSTGYAHYYYYPTGIAVDPSGNVWIGSDASTTHAAVTGSVATGGFVTEIIGAAVPVVTPIAAGLPGAAGGASRLGLPPR